MSRHIKTKTVEKVTYSCNLCGEVREMHELRAYRFEGFRAPVRTRYGEVPSPCTEITSFLSRDLRDMSTSDRHICKGCMIRVQSAPAGS